MAVNGDDEGEADGCLRRGDGDGKNRDHHTGGLLRLRTKTPEGNEVQVGRGQHHLDADQNKNGVAPAERGEQSDAEQCRGDDEEESESGCHSIMLNVKTVTLL